MGVGFEVTLLCEHKGCMIVHGQRRILLNCGEGTQRVANEKKIRLSRLETVLTCQLNTECLGGLGGMMLTVTDVENARHSEEDWNYRLDLIGPPGLADFVHALRQVYRRENATISVLEASYSKPNELCAEDGLVITPIVSLASTSRQPTNEPQCKRPRLAKPERKQSHQVTPKFGTLNVSNLAAGAPELEEIEDCVVSYVVQAPASRGRFRREKAIQLGVLPGPDFGKLTNGMAVTARDGSIVKPEDCMDEAEPAQVVLLVWCPDEMYVENLCKSPEWDRWFRHAGNAFIVHFAPVQVLENPMYIEWMSKFTSSSDHFKHVFVNADMCPRSIVFASSARLQNEFASKLDVDIFGTDLSAYPPKESADCFHLTPNLCRQINHSKLLVGQTMQKLVVNPASHRGVTLPEPEEDLKVPFVVDNSLRDSFDVTFLGTGSAIPSKYRNVTAMLCRSQSCKEEDRQVGAFLLDSGEGTLDQLKRRFGSALCDEIVCKQLKFVWISHMHADHHLGLLSILEKRSRDVEPLVVFGPPSFGTFLLECSFGDTSKFVFVPFQPASEGTNTVFECNQANTAHARALLGCRIQRLTCVPVPHCHDSFAVVLDFDDANRLVYSGDTQPCEQLVEAGMGASVLIHEATFEDDKVAEARAKRHSTVSEAITAGQRMQAKYVLLTHFSQRYPKVSPTISGEYNSKVVFACDLMMLDSGRMEVASGFGSQMANILQDLEKSITN